MKAYIGSTIATLNTPYFENETNPVGLCFIGESTEIQSSKNTNIKPFGSYTLNLKTLDGMVHVDVVGVRALDILAEFNNIRRDISDVEKPAKTKASEEVSFVSNDFVWIPLSQEGAIMSVIFRDGPQLTTKGNEYEAMKRLGLHQFKPIQSLYRNHFIQEITVTRKFGANF